MQFLAKSCLAYDFPGWFLQDDAFFPAMFSRQCSGNLFGAMGNSQDADAVAVPIQEGRPGERAEPVRARDQRMALKPAP